MWDVEVTEQVSFFVEKAGATHLALWMAYRAGDRARTHVLVFAPARPLIPPTGITMGIADSAYDIPRGHVRAWFDANGYVVTTETAAKTT